MKLEELQKHIDMPLKQMRMVVRMLPEPEDDHRDPAYVIMCILICDFFLGIGKKLEDVIGYIVEQDALLTYTRDLLDALRVYRSDSHRVQLPMAFIEVLDNRYVVPISGQFDVYDLVTGEWAPRLPGPPVFSLSLGLHALFIRTVAAEFGCSVAVKAFERGALVQAPE
jgi:hypothetical protein